MSQISERKGKIMKKALTALLAPVFLFACASGPQISSNVNPGTDFREFETYGFIQPLGTDRSNGARTPLSTRLMDSMSREMLARGLSLSSSPDLLVDFVVTAEDRIDVRSTPSHTVHRSHWNRSFTTWPTYSTTVRQYTQGSLVIDLIDPNSNRLVAEGGAQTRINSNTQFTQDDVNDVVGQIMASIWAN
jgi:hypothetical protein